MRAIPLEEVIRLPSPGGGGPSAFRFLGRQLLAFLQPAPGTLAQELWTLDLETGERTRRVTADRGMREEGLSLDEQLRRERLRLRDVGVTSYRSAAGGRTLLVPLGGEPWVERVSEGVATGEGLRRLHPRPVLDPALSPDGAMLAFVEDDELSVADIASGVVRQVTHGARGTGRTHGLAEFVAQEEMKRRTGFWWSNDSRQLAFTEVDETHIPIWRIPYEGKKTPSWEDHRYPFAGAENARVALFVVSADGGEPVRMDLGAFEYLARVSWTRDGALIAQVQDRHQRRLSVIRLDPATGRGQTVLVETSDRFLELDDLFRPLEGGAFLWGSERSGWCHLHLVSPDGEVRPVTSGEWVVDDVVAVDEAARRVYFLGSAEGPLETHLYEVSLDGGPIRRLTEERGTHSVTVDLASRRFVDTWSTRAAPPSTVVRSLDDGGLQLVIHRPDDPRIAKLGLIPPDPITVVNRVGDTLHGHLYRPEGDGPYPTVVFVYGGPHVQRVTESWDATIDLRAQHLRSRGVAVLKIDNRGSSRRGVAFASALHLETGRVEVEDQADAVRQLAKQGVIDPQHVGITGWSYGGYLTLMALVREPGLFRVGVAGAPVTHWDGYDTHYTERYMGLPAENPGGYEASSPLTHVDQLDGHLMVVHGMVDENVHFRHTGRLVNALGAARKDFDLRIFPDERHMPRNPSDRLYMEERIVRFLLQHL